MSDLQQPPLRCAVGCGRCGHDTSHQPVCTATVRTGQDTWPLTICGCEGDRRHSSLPVATASTDPRPGRFPSSNLQDDDYEPLRGAAASTVAPVASELLRRLDAWTEGVSPGPLIRWAAASLRGLEADSVVKADERLRARGT